MRAWEVWQGLVGDVLPGLQRQGQSGRSLIPLLAYALRSHSIEVDPKVQSYLRGVMLFEDLRATEYQRTLREIIAIFSAGKIDFLALKGAALSASVYPDWSMRHSHDIDLLLHQEDQERAAALLEAHDFRRLPALERWYTRSIGLTHRSGLPVWLHIGLFRIPYYQAPLDEIWARRTLVESNGIVLRTLTAADALLHICGQAACSGSRDSLIWVSDAWHIVRSGKLDWDTFLAAALGSRLELPLSVQFAFLRDQMKVRIPEIMIGCLITAAQASPRLAQEAALMGARAGRQGSIRNLLRRTPAWHARAALLMWMVFPSRHAISWSEDPRRNWPLPLLYLVRLIRYIGRRLRRGTRQLFRRSRLHHPRSTREIER